MHFSEIYYHVMKTPDDKLTYLLNMSQEQTPL